MFFFFFFSSRRRHTRLTCDWSSDVCSSDLAGLDRASGGGLGGAPVAGDQGLPRRDLGAKVGTLANELGASQAPRDRRLEDRVPRSAAPATGEAREAE